jgi:hypothetical protein
MLIIINASVEYIFWQPSGQSVLPVTQWQQPAGRVAKATVYFTGKTCCETGI